MNHFLLIFLLLAFTAGAAFTQFFRRRKKNLIILEKSIKILEETFKPIDKNYTIIGLYIGYDATYKINVQGIKNVKAVTIMFPRHSLLYTPIAKLTTRYDKIFLVAHYYKDKTLPGEAHIIRKGYYRLGIRHTIRGIERMQVEKVKIGNKNYYLAYTHRSLKNY